MRRRKRRERYLLDRFYAGNALPAAVPASLSEDSPHASLAAVRSALIESLRRLPPDVQSLTRALEVLTKAVMAEQQLSKRDPRKLSASLAAALNTFGDLILPAE
jgi:hypothetical protein